jgi:hypothetical protein
MAGGTCTGGGCVTTGATRAVERLAEDDDELRAGIEATQARRTLRRQGLNVGGRDQLRERDGGRLRLRLGRGRSRPSCGTTSAGAFGSRLFGGRITL